MWTCRQIVNTDWIAAAAAVRRAVCRRTFTQADTFLACWVTCRVKGRGCGKEWLVRSWWVTVRLRWRWGEGGVHQLIYPQELLNARGTNNHSSKASEKCLAAFPPKTFFVYQPAAQSPINGLKSDAWGVWGSSEQVGSNFRQTSFAPTSHLRLTLVWYVDGSSSRGNWVGNHSAVLFLQAAKKIK